MPIKFYNLPSIIALSLTASGTAVLASGTLVLHVEGNEKFVLSLSQNNKDNAKVQIWDRSQNPPKFVELAAKSSYTLIPKHKYTLRFSNYLLSCDVLFNVKSPDGKSRDFDFHAKDPWDAAAMEIGGFVNYKGESPRNLFSKDEEDDFYILKGSSQ